MKKKLGSLIITALFASFTLTAIAQDEERAESSSPKWVSKYGYWVVESNIKTPKSSTVFFYNNNDILVYSEKVEGVKLNTRRRKTLMKLKEVLDESLIAWNQKKSIKGEQLVKNVLEVNR